jgi:hypothetical protein
MIVESASRMRDNLVPWVHKIGDIYDLYLAVSKITTHA